MKKVLLILSFVFTLFFFSNLSVYADSTSTTNIKIDGNFSDWDGIAKTKVGYSSYFNEAAVIEDDTLYVYLDTKDYPWGYIPTWGGYTITVGGKSYYVNFSGDSSNLTTIGSSGSTNFGNVGTGVETQENNGQTKMFEFSCSLSKVGVSNLNNQSVTVSNSSMGSQVVNAEKIETTAASSSASSSSSASATSNSSSSESKNSDGEYTIGKYNILIDGSFSDWDNISKTDLIEPGDDGNIKRAAMVADGTNLYIYVQMDYTNNYGYNHLQTDGYDLTVGGIPYYFVVRSSDNNSINNSLSNLGDKVKLKIGLGSNYNGNHYSEPSNIEAEAARIANNAGSPTDTMEIKIPLSDFTLSGQSGQIITLKNSNLGSQTITISGGSTGPIVLAVIGLAIALLSLWRFKGSKKRKKDWVNR